MITKALVIAVFSLLFASVAAAQRLEPPTLEQTPLTPAQQSSVRMGVEMHENGDYDGAIRLYEKVLKENPNNGDVLYEMAFAYYMKRDYSKSREIAFKAARYKSENLPNVYALIGNSYDDDDDPKKAVEAYKAGIKLAPPSYQLHFNLAVTYSRLKRFEEARAELKRSALLNPKHPSSQYLLSLNFYQEGYRVPALLAAARFLVLEPTSRRSLDAFKIVQSVMQGGVSQGRNPNEINITMNMSGKKDEGDFGVIETFIGLSKAAGMTEKNRSKTQMQLAVEQWESLITMMEEGLAKADRSKFTWQYYVPYFIEMKKKGYVEAFVYLININSGDNNVRVWLERNSAPLREFLTWTDRYQWPKA